ncbi:hypothetical protein [Helicobacter sp. MIT 05-5294]|uniref:hypothetical protein n=1 Tax=Helicobacter sp. MIT 05-5294 TaxID=1548150 RepID=UPI000B13F2D4|nr:hypothetical protein [Helicobacter sp. MIT 05-5294]TLD89101.1 hypothetical protein LS69_000215 [Helicobacter sp. MIT 05-5294]
MEPPTFKKGGFYKLLPFLSLVLLICLVGVYFGNLLFGNNSLSVLMGLKDKESQMSTEVNRLMHENANLQKELFELKGLEPQ